MTARHGAVPALLAVVCGLVLPLAACSADPPPAAPAPSTSVANPENLPVVVNAVEPTRTLLPADIGDEYGARVGSLIYRGLLRYDAKGRLVNEVAEEISNPDPLTYRIKVRKGWVFTNGEPVTAASFVNAWSFAADPARGMLRADAFSPIVGYQTMRGAPEPTPPSPSPSSPPSGTAAPSAPATPVTPPTSQPTSPVGTTPSLTGLSIIDELEFSIRLTAPHDGFRDLLASVEYAPLPSAALKDPTTYGAAPIGNGPYQLAGGWLAGKEIRLAYNSSYSGTDPARNGGVTFRFSPDPSLTYPALLDGRIDVLDSIPATALDRYKADLGFRAANQAVGAATSLVFPMYRPEWAGPEGRRLRRAMSRAIDRRSLADSLFAGTRTPAGDLSAPVLPGFVPDLCEDICRYDADAARALLRAPEPNPTPSSTASGAKATTASPAPTDRATATPAPAVPVPALEIAYGADGGGRPAVEALCSAVTSALQMPCTPHPYPSQAALERLAARHELTMPMLSTHRMSRPDMGGFFSPRYVAGSSRNLSGYSGKAAQELLVKAAAAQGESRISLYREAQKVILGDLPEIPLWYVNATVAGGARVAPVKVDVFGLPLYTELKRN